PQQQPQPQQVYSTCTGRKKALCIGINYIGHPQALRGCINDARHVHDFLIKRWGYKDEDIVMLTDDSKNPRQRPTRANIIDAMRWLVKDARTNDSLFFHYSGHGGQTRDLDGDELDGYDEVIYPMDFQRSGHLTDDVMHRILVKSLPRGCRLTALFDCCHSGTVLDMPYIYRSDGKLKGLQINERTRLQKATNADVITWSGSKDGQTSADTFAGGVAVGAMSYAFITALTAKPNQSYQELLKAVRKILYDKYSQKPQLSSSHHIDTNLRFVM
ncbi:peptidase C14, partial [Hymenopellis radicata]